MSAVLTQPYSCNRPDSPHPAHLARQGTLNDGTVITIRPIRPQDAVMEQDFVRGLSVESRYFRFMNSPQELSPEMLSHFTHIDYDLHMAFIAVTARGGRETQAGVARYIADRRQAGVRVRARHRR